jgi:hypothetical protein
LLDFTKPVAVTLISILHAISDGDDPHAIVARLLGTTARTWSSQGWCGSRNGTPNLGRASRARPSCGPQ